MKNRFFSAISQQRDIKYPLNRCLHTYVFIGKEYDKDIYRTMQLIFFTKNAINHDVQQTCLCQCTVQLSGVTISTKWNKVSEKSSSSSSTVGLSELMQLITLHSAQ